MSRIPDKLYKKGILHSYPHQFRLISYNVRSLESERIDDLEKEFQSIPKTSLVSSFTEYMQSLCHPILCFSRNPYFLLPDSV